MTDLAPDVAAALLEAARAARSRSYAPYSGFDAGAAVLRGDGEVVTGSIVENISLGLAMCAERVAMFAAATSSPSSSSPSSSSPVITALVLAAPDTGPRRTWPCGACRQVALELGGPDLLVAAIGADTAPEDVEWRRLDELLVDAPRRR